MEKEQNAEIVANKDITLKFENAGSIPLDYNDIIDIRWSTHGIVKSMEYDEVEIIDENTFIVKIDAIDTKGMDNQKELHEAKIIDSTGTYALARGFLTILRTRFRD